ncbi:MAG: hypothetical protein ACOC7T_03120 [Planctomycetota bacterium]
MSSRTSVSIEGDDFLIDGKPTYRGRTWHGMRVEGLLMNSRMVQGIFDDLNAKTRSRWDYPDGPWDPERNTREFVQAMPRWREHGLLSFTVNLQGGNPVPYSKDQPWHNSAFNAAGELREEYMERLTWILDRADELGMAPILGYFYFGQDGRFQNEQAIVRAAEQATDWLIERGYRNVLIEIANEVDNRKYSYDILREDRCDELIHHVQQYSEGRLDTPAGRLLVGASMCGGRIPPNELVEPSDFLLPHGNGVGEPDRIRAMVDECRNLPAYAGQPVVFNEDDHYAFEAPDNNMLAAIEKHAGWGFFDWRRDDEGYDAGYQSVPVNWGISSERKRGFFKRLAEVTGAR